MLGDLFEIDNTLSFNADRLVSGNDYDYVTRTSLNQGVFRTTGFVNEENINPAGTWSLGLLQMDFFYRKKPWYAGQFVRKITPKIKIKESAILFFSTLLNKQKPKLLSVLVRDVDNVFRSAKIQLPTHNGDIDFDFMESFIAELEAQRIAELSAYLKVSVDDYVLPCLTSSFQNQGLNYYAPKTGATVISNVISLPSNSDVYRAYYQSRDFTVLSDSYAIRWKDDEIELSPNQYLFMVMCINKVTDLPIYSYKNKLGGWNVVKHKDIRLPEKDGKIDFAFMDNFISAIKKLAIKDVVKYSDAKINATKKVVSC